jgi:predicted dehydrogenase
MLQNGPVATAREVAAKFSEYAVLGYSGAGVIAAKHATVGDLEVGDRVSYGGEGTGHGERIHTGRNLVARIPKDVGFDQACFATLGSIAMNSVRVAAVGLGESVAVIGLGLVGQLIVQLARAQGARVIAIDLKPERVEAACAAGAEAGCLAGESLQEQVKSATGGKGADCVIIAAAAKSAAPCEQALEICRDRGRIVIVGAVEVAFSWYPAYLKEIQILFARAYGPGSYDAAYEVQGRDYPFPYVRWTENRNMEEFLRLVARKEVNVDSLVTHRFALDDAPDAYRTIMDPGSRSLAVLLQYRGDEEASSSKPQHTTMLRAKTMAAPGEIGIALIGSGNLARWVHLPILRKIPGTSLRAVCSANPVRAKSYASRFGAAYCTTDFGEVLKDDAISMVVITSRNQHHAKQAIEALRAGKHVFVEKPMALTEEECRDVYQATQESGKLLTVGFNRRFSPFYAPFRTHLARRTAPAVVQCRVNSPGISGSYWMADPAIGGAILGEACHFVDLMAWMLGAEPTQVTAYSLPPGKGEPVGENNLAASFQFADGSIGNLTYCTVGSKTSAGERVEAFQQGLGITSENFKRLNINGSVRLIRRSLFPDKGYKDQMQSFIECLRKGTAPIVTVWDGVRSSIACLRMLESARTGQPARIDVASVLGVPTSNQA